MNCNLCGSSEGYLAYLINKKVVSICGDCWYSEMKWERKGVRNERS